MYKKCSFNKYSLFNLLFSESRKMSVRRSKEGGFSSFWSLAFEPCSLLLFPFVPNTFFNDKRAHCVIDSHLSRRPKAHEVGAHLTRYPGVPIPEVLETNFRGRIIGDVDESPPFVDDKIPGVFERKEDSQTIYVEETYGEYRSRVK